MNETPTESLPDYLTDAAIWTLPDGVNVPVYTLKIDPEDWKYSTGSEAKDG